MSKQKWYGWSGDWCELKDTEMEDAKKVYGWVMIGDKALLFDGIYSKAVSTVDTIILRYW